MMEKNRTSTTFVTLHLFNTFYFHNTLYNFRWDLNFLIYNVSHPPDLVHLVVLACHCVVRQGI